MVASALQEPGSPSKDDNCDCSLKRYNSISDLAQLVIPGFVHQQGHPINQQPNAGFSRRGEPGSLGEDSGPSGIGWAWGEECVAMKLRVWPRVWFRRSVTKLPPPDSLR